MRKFLLPILLFVLNAFATEFVTDSSAVSGGIATDSVSAAIQNSAVADTSAVLDSAVVDSSAIQNSTVADSVATDSVVPCRKNFPLPRQSAYTGSGIIVALAGGLFNPTKECDCLGVWQGQLEFFYTEKISASIDVRFFGGDLDSDVMVRYQRYRVNVRFHFPHEQFDWFLAPVVGFESTDLGDIRDEWHERDMERWIPGLILHNDDKDDEEREVEDCERMFSLEGFSIGAEAGAGVRLGRFFGATGSVSYEFNFGGAQIMSLSPGVAFNLQEVWPWAMKHLNAVWVSFEAGFHRYFNRGVDDWATSGILGLQIGI